MRLTELGLEEQNERCGCTISLLVVLSRVVHELVELPVLAVWLGQNKELGEEGQKENICGIHRRWGKGAMQDCHRVLLQSWG